MSREPPGYWEEKVTAAGRRLDRERDLGERISRLEGRVDRLMAANRQEHGLQQRIIRLEGQTDRLLAIVEKLTGALGTSNDADQA